MSSGIGAKRSSISMSTTVRAPPLSSSLALTLPTLTPAIRTSDSVASVAASGNATWKR